MFQSPSLRGSGRFLPPRREPPLPAMRRFQSPSLRGSGRFLRRRRRAAWRCSGFNPLHCGAVVASLFHTVSFRSKTLVSIPFIAGQWSLPAFLAANFGDGFLFQSPSLRGSGRFLLTAYVDTLLATFVSIPFIAGQWSLRRDAARGVPMTGSMFQSPSLRGSGRFAAASAAVEYGGD